MRITYKVSEQAWRWGLDTLVFHVTWEHGPVPEEKNEEHDEVKDENGERGDRRS